MVLKETDYNNYIVFIEKYLEITWFDGLVVETSKKRIILCYRTGFEIKGSGGAKCSQIEPKCS